MWNGVAALFPAPGVVRTSRGRAARALARRVRGAGLRATVGIATICLLFDRVPGAHAGVVDFGLSGPFGIGVGANDVAVGDFDGDGNRDIAVSRLGDESVGLSVLFGDGAGGVDGGRSSLVFGTSVGLAAADVDRDGDDDLALIALSGDVLVVLSNGDGSFAEPRVFGLPVVPTAIVAADVDGDGYDDFLVSGDPLFFDPGVGRVVFMRNQGLGFFGEWTGLFNRSNYATGSLPLGVGVADFNGDGVNDVAVSNSEAGEVQLILRQDDSSVLDDVYVPLGEEVAGLAVGRFNPGISPDLTVRARHGDGVFTLIDPGDSGEAGVMRYTLARAPGSIAVGDLDLDGFDEIVLGTWDDHIDEVVVLCNDGDGVFTESVVPAIDGVHSAVAVDDVDDDGDRDIVVVRKRVFSGSEVGILVNGLVIDGVREWAGPPGEFTDGAAWVGGRPPGPDEQALFARSGPPVDVTFDAAVAFVQTRLLTVVAPRNHVFLMPDTDYLVSGEGARSDTAALLVEAPDSATEPAELRITAGTGVPSDAIGVSTPSLSVGGGDATRGVVSVVDRGLSVGEHAVIGGGGEGRVWVSGAGHFTIGDSAGAGVLTLGEAAGSVGELLLEAGEASALTGVPRLSVHGQSMVIGAGGTGVLRHDGTAPAAPADPTLSTVSMNDDVVLGRDAGSAGAIALLTTSDDDSRFVWQHAGSGLVIGGGGAGTLTVGSHWDVVVAAGLMRSATPSDDPWIIVGERGVLEGTGTVTAAGAVRADGTVRPGLTPIDRPRRGGLTLFADYEQARQSEGDGLLVIEIGADEADSPLLDVRGHASLGGGLLVEVSADAVLPPDDVLDGLTILRADSIDGVFEGVILPGVDADESLGLVYDMGDPVGGVPATVSLALLVDENPTTFEDDDGGPAEPPSEPSDGVTVDIDGDELLDLVLAVPAVTGGGRSAPGSVVVLFNGGTTEGGEWRGYTSSQIITMEVGVNPSAIAVANLDRFGGPDIVVANKGPDDDPGADTLTVLFQDFQVFGEFVLSDVLVLPVGDAPVGVALADFDGDGLIDIASADSGMFDGVGQVSFFPNLGDDFGDPRRTAMFGLSEPPLMLPGGGPRGVRPGDLNASFGSEVVVIQGGDDDGDGSDESAGTATVASLVPAGRSSVIAQIPVGPDPRGLIVADLNGDGRPDIATVNTTGNSLSFIANTGEQGSIDFDGAVNVPVGVQMRSPISITSGDFSGGDSDTDLAIVLDAVGDGLRNDRRVIRVLENNNAAGPIAFTDVGEFASGDIPFVARAGNIDNQNDDDIVTLNESLGGGTMIASASGGFVTALLSVPPPILCPGDTDGDFLILPNDPYMILANFGEAVQGGAIDGDVAPAGEPDGRVGPDDLFLTLSTFGQSCEDQDQGEGSPEVLGGG